MIDTGSELVEVERPVARDPRWASDPSESWDEMVEITGCGSLPLDSPESPAGDSNVRLHKFWPGEPHGILSP